MSCVVGVGGCGAVNGTWESHAKMGVAEQEREKQQNNSQRVFFGPKNSETVTQHDTTTKLPTVVDLYEEQGRKTQQNNSQRVFFGPKNSETVTEHDTKTKLPTVADLYEEQGRKTQQNNGQRVFFGPKNSEKGWANSSFHQSQGIPEKQKTIPVEESSAAKDGTVLPTNESLHAAVVAVKFEAEVINGDFLDVLSQDFKRGDLPETIFGNTGTSDNQTDIVENTIFQGPEIFLMAETVVFFMFVTIVMYCCAKEKKSDPQTKIDQENEADPTKNPKTEILTPGNIGCYNMNKEFRLLQDPQKKQQSLKNNPFVLHPDIAGKIDNDYYSHAQLIKRFDNADEILKRILRDIIVKFEYIREEKKIDTLKHLGFINIMLRTKCQMTGKLDFIDACDSDEGKSNWNLYANPASGEALADLKLAQLQKKERIAHPELTDAVATDLDLFYNQHVIHSVYAVRAAPNFEHDYRQEYLRETVDNMKFFKGKSQEEQKIIVLIMRRVLHIVYFEEEPPLYPSVSL